VGRKRKTPVRVASTLRALHTFDQVTAEKKRTERAQARVDRLKARAEEKELREATKALSKAERKARDAANLAIAEKIVAARREDPGVIAELLEAYETPSAQAPKAPEPAERSYVVTGKDANNEPVRHYLPPVQPSAPVAEKPAPTASVAPVVNSIFPIWIHENRQATREEWQAHQRARMPRGNAPYRENDGFYHTGNGAGEHVAGNGVRVSQKTSTMWSRNLKDL
jgi:hypothetical protein